MDACTRDNVVSAMSLHAVAKSYNFCESGNLLCWPVVAHCVPPRNIPPENEGNNWFVGLFSAGRFLRDKVERSRTDESSAFRFRFSETRSHSAPMSLRSTISSRQCEKRGKAKDEG